MNTEQFFGRDKTKPELFVMTYWIEEGINAPLFIIYARESGAE